jgi:hypothetical protein
MRNLKLFSVLILLTQLLLFFGCDNEDDVMMNEPADPAVFDFEVGQKILYSLFEGERYNDNAENELFAYTNDTLEVEVINKEGNVYTFRERILPSSAMHQSADDYYWLNKDSVYTNEWVFENDTLKILRGENVGFFSHLLLDHGFLLVPSGSIERGFLLPLQDFIEQQVFIEGWKTSEDYCECDMDLYTEKYSLFGVSYDRLNVAIRNTPMQSDGHGSTYIYNTKEGIVRSVSYSWWTGTGFGWDRIPD